jgi:hypothetical protein
LPAPAAAQSSPSLKSSASSTSCSAPSLGGNARTTILCTMTTAPVHLDESLSTLRFGQLCKLIKNAAQENVQMTDKMVAARAAKESDMPNFKGSFLGRFPLVSADFWTSDHLSERSRSVDAIFGKRARETRTTKRR